MRTLIKNPLTQWLWWLARTYVLKRKLGDLHIDIGYMAMISSCTFGRYNRVCAGAILSKVSLGDMSYVGERSRLSDVRIGKFSCIGPEVLAGLGMHPSRNFVSSHPAFFSPNRRAARSLVGEASFDEFAPIEIGHDVWIGARAVLLDGITIGNGAIVGAGAVVAGDIPPYAVAVGVPARVVRKRFTDEQIAKLLESAWWDMDLNELERRALSFGDIDLFLHLERGG